MGLRVRMIIWVTVGALLAGPASARADAPLPWYEGVSERDQARARALFAEAGELKKQLLLADALPRYQEALSRWNNPEIHYELATVLAKMGRSLDAWEQLQRVWSWGPDALVGRSREHARELEKALLREHLAVIEVRCEEPGATIALNGDELLVCPGTARKVVRSGQHLIKANKPGYLPATEVITALSGSQRSVASSPVQSLSVQMYREHRREARWPQWQPWAVTGGGVAIGTIGIIFSLTAARHRAQLKDALAMCVTDYCPAAQVSVSKNRTEWEQRLGTGALAIGGAVALTGLIGVFLNQPRLSRRQQPGRIDVTPLVSPDVVGVRLRRSF